MSDRDLIYKVLFEAILELRIEGAETKNAKVFHLANLIHQLPNRLKEMEEWKVDASDVLDELKAKARESKIDSWMRKHVSEADASPPHRQAQSVTAE